MAGILAMQPEVIVLDEPTAGMDPAGRRHFLEQIKKLNQEQGLTVVFVTHNMEDIATLAQRLFVFSQGQLALQGRPQDIFQSIETIREIGLDIPVITDLLQRIRSSGKTIRTDLFSVEEACREIVHSFRKKDGQTP